MNELERRWNAAREVMVSKEVDALIIQGANNATGGGAYLRWFTGLSAFSAQPQIIIFPRSGLMTAIGHGPRGEVADLKGNNRDYPGIGQRISTPSFPSIGYTGRYDAELLADEVKKIGLKRIALIGANNMYYGPISQALARLPSVGVVDVMDDLDRVIAVKSPEEIGFIRKTAQMQDEVLEKVRAHIKPGMRDFEVMAHAQYVGQLLGSEGGYYLGCSAARGSPLGHRTRPQQDRQIGDNDIFLWQAETTGPGGFFVHIARIFSFGKAPADLNDRFEAMVEAQAFTVKLLKPNAQSAEIFAAYNAYMKARGLPEEMRLHCHGQGYTSVERPLIRYDETMPIAANMNIGIHPSFSNANMFVTVCDNFLTHSDGTVERLHKAPSVIFEL
jgi:Xaa-Pro aminopeptidase